MNKYRLFAPGPTMVPAEVMAANASPQLHHRSPEFRAIYREVTDNLAYVFQTESDPLMFVSSGTGVMEATVANLFSRGDRVAAVVAGKFGERWRNIGRAYGLEVLSYELAYGETTDADAFRAWLGKQGDVKGILLTHSETSTGTFHDIRAVAEKVRDLGPLIVVDAVSSLGALELKTDEWGLDAVASGSQKALGCPPGVSFVALSERAWKAMETADLPRFYWDFRANRKQLEAANSPLFTTATSVVCALREGLKRVREETIEGMTARHALLAEATRAGVLAIGCRLFSKCPSNAVTAVLPPEGLDVEEMRKIVRKDYGILFAGGQGEMMGKIFRIGHMGYFDRFDVITAIAALESVFPRLGYPVEPGSGVRAAQEVLNA
ncbi:MAG: alanine--glyoxylate aminotransferase family protein [Candidatus Eisenbacteria bacterium]|nr:alanine--glyoxylate aminotransferase family protein [Candidatus Eisenbacteria bacterium]